MLAQRGHQRLAGYQGTIEHHAGPSLARPGGAGRGGEGLLGLGPKSLQGADALSLGGRSQGVQRIDSQFLEQPAGPLGAQAWQAGHGQEPGRELLPQPGGCRDHALGGQRQDLLLDRRADSRQLGGPAFAGQRAQRHRSLSRGLGRIPVGDDPMDDRSVELVEVTQFLERRRNLAVGGIRHVS